MRNCLNIFAAKYLIYILAMLTSVLTARALGPEGKGTQGVIVAIAGIFTQFGGLGLTSANTYYIAKNKEARYGIMGNSYLAAALTGSLIVLFCQSAPLWIHHASFSQKDLTFAAGLFVIQILNLYQNNCLIAMGKIKEYARAELIPVALYLFLVAGGALVAWLTPYSLIALSAACYGISFIYSYRKSDLPVRKLSVDKEYLKKQFSYGIIIYIICFFQYLILRVDVLMIDQYLGAAGTGYYSVAVNLIDTLNMIYVSVGMLVFPKIANMDSKRDEIIFMKKIITAVSAVAVLTIAIGVLLAKPVITILYGAAYSESVGVFYCLLFGTLFRAVVTLENNYIAGKNENKKVLFIIMLCFGVNILLNRIWIPEKGITGAAMASNLTYLLMCLATSFILWTITRKNDRGI